MSIKISSVVKKLRSFYWRVGFGLLLEFHRGGSVFISFYKCLFIIYHTIFSLQQFWTIFVSSSSNGPIENKTNTNPNTAPKNFLSNSVIKLVKPLVFEKFDDFLASVEMAICTRLYLLAGGYLQAGKCSTYVQKTFKCL